MKTVALRRLAEVNPPSPEFDRLSDEDDVLFLPLETVWSDSKGDQTRLLPKAAVASGYTRFHAGDVVTPKVTPTFQAGRSMLTVRTGAGTTELHVLRARPGIDARWISYAVRSKHFLEEGVTAFQGVAGLQRVPAEFVADFRIADVDAGEQRRIADFLDDRVARIDQIITARGIQLDLINEVAVSGTSDLLGAVGPEGPPLSAVCRIVDTEHKTAPTVAGGGYWIAGTGAIRDGRLVHDRLRETDSDSFTEWTSRGVPEHGDVLLTREAPVGEVALVSVGDPPVAIGQRVVLLKPNAKALDSGFLRLVLMAGEIRRIIAMASAGSLHPHLNMADIARLRIPNSALEDQRSLGRAHQQILMQAQSRRSTLGGSLDRLIEYKQALITAAVTGEIDVTTAGSGIPG